MRSSTHRISATAAVAVLITIVAGCSSPAASRPASPSGGLAGSGGPATSNATSPWLALESEIGPDGEVSLATALKAWALAFGPLPGTEFVVHPEDAPIDGTPAILWIERHRSELTPPQRAAVDAILGRPAVSSAPTDRRVSSLAQVAAAAVDFVPDLPRVLAATASDLQGVFDEVLIAIANRMSLNAFRSVLFEVLPESGGQQLGGYTTVVPNPSDPDGFPSNCTVHVSSSRFETFTGPDEVRSALAQMVFMCFLRNHVNSALEEFLPAWVMRGLSTWAGETLTGGTELSDAPWHGWLESGSTIGLFSRTDSAFGFFAHVAQYGFDPWHQSFSVVQAATQGSVAAYQAIRGYATAMEWDWGASYYRDPDPWGKVWETEGPGVPGDAIAPPRVHATVDDVDPNPEKNVVTIKASALTGVPAQVELAADVITVEAGGAKGRMTYTINDTLAADDPFDKLDGTNFCTRPGGCTCPAGTSGFGAKFVNIEGGTSQVGLTGGLSGSAVTFQGTTLDQFCHADCIVGGWVLEDGSYATLINAVLGGGALGATPAPGVPFVEDVSGPMLMTFGRDGTWSQLYTGLTVRFVIPQPNVNPALFKKLELENVTEGILNGEWLAEFTRQDDGSQVGYFTVDNGYGELRQVSVVILGGVPQPPSDQASIKPVSLGDMAAAGQPPNNYECIDDSLKVELHLESDARSVTFTRRIEEQIP